MQKLKIKARSEREINVRHDRRRSRPSLTKGQSMVGEYPPDANPTGNWRKWWHAGCGVDEKGVPVCDAGHAYHIERYKRAAHARSKVLSRRKERRKLNRIVDEG